MDRVSVVVGHGPCGTGLRGRSSAARRRPGRADHLFLDPNIEQRQSRSFHQSQAWVDCDVVSTSAEVAKTPNKQRNERFWSPKIPDDHWDYIVIGTGMGGMTTAALLAKLGKRVLMLEQHYVPGGFTHAFKRKAWEWDVGVHAVGEVTEHSFTGRLLSQLTDSRLEWASLGKVYDEFHYPDDFRIDFPDNPEDFRSNLLAAFPKEGEAIDRYLKYVREVSGAMKGYYLARTAPGGVAGKVAQSILGRKAKSILTRRTKDVIDQLTDDPKLRAVMAAQWGYYGAPPSRSSFAIQALVVKHFLWGGYYPVGGSKRIAVELLRTVAQAGGWTAIRSAVDEIVVERDRAVGVRLDDGRFISADRVISAAGVGATVRNLLPETHRQSDWSKKLEALAPGPAHVCLYIGFEGDIRQAGASAANKWFYNTWDAESEAWRVGADGPLPDADCLYCSFPSLKDPEHDPGERLLHTGEVVTFVPWEDFKPWLDSRWQRRPEAYAAFKNKIETKLLEQFLERMPKLRPLVKHVELSTPLSTDHFCRPVHGSIYGLEPTPERFENPDLRPRAKIENLYFSGSEVATVGVIGAMMGGVLAATAAEPIGAANYLRQLS